MSDPVLDLVGLEEVFGDDRAGLIELVEMVVGDDAATLAPLHAAIAAHDATALREAAHGIKGAAANVGAHEVASAALEIETFANANAWADVTAGLRALDAALAGARAALASYRSGSA